MNKRLSLLSFAILSVLAVPTLVRADDIAATQRRLAERAPAIDVLKQKGLVGEDNRGFLDPRGTLSAMDAATVSAENNDRNAAYIELAKRSGSTPDVVGKVRAKRIAEGSTKGIWLQNEAGTWYQK